MQKTVRAYEPNQGEFIGYTFTREEMDLIMSALSVGTMILPSSSRRAICQEWVEELTDPEIEVGEDAFFIDITSWRMIRRIIWSLVYVTKVGQDDRFCGTEEDLMPFLAPITEQDRVVHQISF